MQSPDRDKNDEQRERRKLMMRAGMAAVIVIVLLVGLVLFKNGSKPEPKAPAQAAVVPDDASVSPPTIGISMTTSSNSSSSSSSSAASPQSSSSSSSLSEELQQAIAEAPDTTQAALQRTPVRPQRIVEGRGQSSPQKPTPSAETESILAVPQLPVSARQSSQESSASHSVTHSAVTPDRVAAAPVPSAVPTPVQVTPTPALPAGSYAVQLGVFANVTNAEELRQRLKREGIPAQLETRVQVGPFKNQQEALRAQEKLRKLGLGRGMLVVAGKKS